MKRITWLGLFLMIFFVITLTVFASSTSRAAPAQPCTSDDECDDSNECTDDYCVSGFCEYSYNSAPCDDGDVCTVGDTCSGGVCIGNENDCDDGVDCTTDTCEPGIGCVNTPDDAFCDDSVDCTTDTCDEVSGCVNTPDDALCVDDGNPCTDEYCHPANGCTTDNNTDLCDDGNACTEGDTCGGGECIGGSVVDCNDGIDCTDDSCDPASGCVNDPVDSDCDDGDVCTEDSCDPASGCVNTPIATGDPTGAGATPSTYCEETESTVTLNATCTDSTVEWYTTQSGCNNTVAGGPTDHTGSPWVVPAPLETTSYWVRCNGECGLSEGCVQVDVIVNAKPVANAGSDVTICNGESTTLDASGSSGNGLTYAWTPGCATTVTHEVNPTTTTTYTLEVTSSEGCTDRDEVIVTVCDNPTTDAGPNKAVCQGGSIELGPVPTLRANGSYSYKWSPSTYLDDDEAMNPTASPPTDAPSESITYTLVVTELDCNSCTGSDEMVLTINENPDCTITVDDDASDGFVEPGSTHTAWIQNPPAGTNSILWTVEGADIVGPDDELTVTFKTPLEPTLIKIKVEVEDGNGCECVFDPPIEVIDPDPQAGILKVYRYIPTLAGWGLIGLAALMAGAGAWAVRRRKRK